MAGGIIVLGSINMDLVVRVPRMPRAGETVLGGEFFTTLGGKGANQAVAAARAARAPVSFLAAVGDDPYGQQARATLTRETHLSLDLVKTVTGCATGVALITVDAAGENMISVASGANHALSPADVDAVPEEVWRGAGVFLACLESPLATVARGLARAKEFGLLTILNPAPAPDTPLPAEMLRLIDVLTPNEIEATALLRGRGASTSPTDIARQLQSRGVRQVIVTRGSEGCLVVDHEISTVPARAAKAVDHNGGRRCLQRRFGRRPLRRAVAVRCGAARELRGSDLGNPRRRDRLARHAGGDRRFLMSREMRPCWSPSHGA